MKMSAREFMYGVNFVSKLIHIQKEMNSSSKRNVKLTKTF